jgi:hypothetical protein
MDTEGEVFCFYDYLPMRELFLKQTNCHTIGTVTKSIIKITEKCKTVTPATQKQDHLLSWLGTGKCFQHVSKMPTPGGYKDLLTQEYYIYRGQSHNKANKCTMIQND